MTSSRPRLTRARLEVILRAGAVLTCAVTAWLIGNPARSVAALVMLAAIAALATSLRGPVWLRYGALVAEAVAASIVALIAPGDPLALLPYLAAPVIVAALMARYLGALIVAASAALTLTIIATARMADRSAGADIILWAAVTAAVGLATWGVLYLRRRFAVPNSDYRAANRLLSALRDVARELPEGLDSVALAESALDRLRALDPDVGSAAVYVRSDSGRLVPIAAWPAASDTAWAVESDRGLSGQAWDTGIAVQRTGSFTDANTGASAALPLKVDARRIGLICVERPGALWSPEVLTAAQAIADDTALRIDTAALFSEVRALATAEERRRLSREIHDGVAQEVAALGFLVDSARAASTDPQVSADLDHIREELTRLVTELRLSIFDLRSDVGASMRLGEALADYARSVGSQVGWTVHLVLEEGPTRLARSTEAELLRIAQEAITNTRRHAGATNVWVALRVVAPTAYLRVADDGTGSPASIEGHFGLAVMRERAARIGATLTLRPRPGGGTVVEVVLGRIDSGDDPVAAVA